MRVLSNVDPANCLADLDWVAPTVSILAFLTDIIFSWTVSKIPDASKFSTAVVVASLILFWLSSIKVNTFLPVSNFGFTFIFGFGTKKLPCIDAA